MTFNQIVLGCIMFFLALKNQGELMLLTSFILGIQIGIDNK